MIEKIILTSYNMIYIDTILFLFVMYEILLWDINPYFYYGLEDWAVY